MQSQAVEPSAESPAEEPGIPLEFGSVAHVVNNVGFQIGNNHGNIIFSHHKETTLFESLAAHNQSQGSILLARTTLSKKARLQTGRRNRTYYEPYVEVKNRPVKQRLIYLSNRFNFLDRGFAEYFQTVVPSFDKTYVQQRLKDIRQDIAKGQTQNITPSGEDEPETNYLGDLGEFCERVSQAWNPDSRPIQYAQPKFHITHRRDQEIFEYLQDAFEVPYWELMLDLFLQWRANSRSLSGDIVLKVLGSLEREIKTGRRQLLSDLEAQSEDKLEDLAPILEGIDARLAVLGTVCDMTGPLLLELEDLVTAAGRPILASAENNPPMESSGSGKEKVPVTTPTLRFNADLRMVQENVALIALILLFLTAAIVPGYKAFAISMDSNTPGSIGDADFWYLIQSSIMSVLGNLTMVIPLLKKSWFSPAYNTMWIFFTLGVAFAILSIAIYPLVNTGWSFMVAFFGSIASVASVLVTTQAAAKDVPHKIKND
ncbi:hypothetical protein PEBR_09359 [Penicillium brasilianum]|uniref:Uncharacterized protein n=1 Tax=Penicillium brasilianum TaxID=104259 RepID=A0A1S9S1S8_PENBI|nr:hypothetical protein PEBR_09359 [Penicillium brasilianum]